MAKNDKKPTLAEFMERHQHALFDSDGKVRKGWADSGELKEAQNTLIKEALELMAKEL